MLSKGDATWSRRSAADTVLIIDSKTLARSADGLDSRWTLAGYDGTVERATRPYHSRHPGSGVHDGPSVYAGGTEIVVNAGAEPYADGDQADLNGWCRILNGREPETGVVDE